MILNNTIHAFGLDIDDETIKMAKIKKKKTFRGKSRLFLDAFGEVVLPKNTIKNGEILNPKNLASAISKLLKSIDIKPDAAVASIFEKKSFLKLLTINAKNKENLKESLPKIVENHFPLPFKDIYLDWQIIKEEEENSIIKYTVLVAAGLRKNIDSLTNILEEAGIMPLAIEPEGVSIARRVPNSMSANKNQAIIDIGRTASSIIFVSNGVPVLSLSLPISGDGMTQVIAKSLNLSFRKAETTKIKCGLDFKLCKKSLRPALSFIISDTVLKIQKSLHFYKNSFNREKIPEIYLSGGGANLSKLDSVLSQKLKIKVRKCNPIENIMVQDDKFKKDALKYTNAIGLALRGILYDYP